VSPQYLEIRELAAWGFDHPIDRGSLQEEELRNAAREAQGRVAVRVPYPADHPISVEETRKLGNVLAGRRDAVLSSGEFNGLTWELAVADLRKLIAFQRRIALVPSDSCPVQRETDMQQLIDLALPLHPMSESPYMEVASYCGRWFLRDGYHRSFRLLNKGVHLIPCVVVYANSLVQMGAVGSRFFSQDTLFSERPPMVTDFVDEKSTMRYRRALPEQIVPSTNQQSQHPVTAACCQQKVL
jgi:hypothetical protein